MTVIRRRCPYCSADPDGELVPCLEAMRLCKNCRADIACKGQWTGYGWAGAQRLVERFGKDAVRKADAELAGKSATPRAQVPGDRKAKT
jgi:hypothetical protein